VTKILGIIQARMSSTRLPNKVMLPILEKPIIWHIYNRIRNCDLDYVCIATSTNPNDDEIEKFALNENIPIFRGQEELVLDRLLGAAEKFSSDAIVRITADCPFVDPHIVNRLIDMYRKDPTLDYVSNTIHRTFPDGLDVEVISNRFMKFLSANLDEFYKEWFIMYVHEKHENFRCINYENQTNLSHLRWTIDYPEDYKFVKKIYEELARKSGIFDMQDILNLIKHKPYLTKINQKYPADTSSIIYKNEKNKKTSFELYKNDQN